MKVKKDNSIVNKLSKTKDERFPDLAAFQEERAAEFRAEQKAMKRHEIESKKSAEKARKEAERLRSYSDVMLACNMKANTENASSIDDSAAKEFEDEFM